MICYQSCPTFLSVHLATLKSNHSSLSFSAFFFSFYILHFHFYISSILDLLLLFLHCLCSFWPKTATTTTRFAVSNAFAPAPASVAVRTELVACGFCLPAHFGQGGPYPARPGPAPLWSSQQSRARPQLTVVDMSRFGSLQKGRKTRPDHA